MTQYAISRWPDTDDIMKRLDALIAKPVVGLTQQRREKVLAYFEQRCSGSKELNDRARKLIPGGVQHNLAFNYPFPLAVSRAEGAYLWDVDGNRYIDFLQAGGPTLLGSNYAPVREKVVELLSSCGSVTGLFHEYELLLAELINRHMPAVEMFRMLGSGTEGVMAAIRAARTFTQKPRIIKVGGAYHGWSDQMVFGLHIPGTGALEAHGIPAGCNRDTQEFFPNDLEGLAHLLEKNEKKGGTAAVILEPLGPESGTRPVTREFNARVRELCDQYGTLLIFDEVVTGFRVGLGGAHGYFGVKPDLTVFGKCVAGGYPAAGGVGGSREVMSTLAAGLEAGKARAYVGGTLSANPLSCVAGYYSIREIEATGAHIRAGAAGDRLCDGLQKIIAEKGLPYVAFNHGSIVHLETSAPMFVNVMEPSAIEDGKHRKHVMEEMGAAFMAEGIVSLAGSRLYTSMADTDEVIDEALEAFERVMADSEGVCQV